MRRRPAFPIAAMSAVTGHRWSAQGGRLEEDAMFRKRWSRKYRPFIITGSALITTGMFLLTLLNTGSSVYVAVLPMIVIGRPLLHASL